MGSGGGQTQTSKSEPWSKQQPYLEKGFSEAERIYDEGPAPFFPGQTFVDMSDPTQAGLEGMVNRAQSGSGVTQGASSYASGVLGGNSDNPYSDILSSGVEGMQSTARGDFLGANPHLDDIYGRAAGRVTDSFENTVLPGIAAQFGSSGGTGGALHGLALSDAGGKLTDSLGDLGASIYGGAYESERDRMTGAQSGLTSTGANLYGTGVNERLSALGMSPGLAAAEYGDFDRLLEAGKGFEGYDEKELQDQINRHNYNENADLQSLQDYLSMIQGNYGGTSVTRGSSGGSPWQTGLGAALTLGSMFSDKRLKNIIGFLGKADNGVNLYAYSYKSSPDIIRIGVIAQEVQHTHPHVVTDMDGFLMVDYNKLFGSE